MATTIRGRLVLADRVVAGWVEVAGGLIASVEADDRVSETGYICPGFVDIHVHGWGGHDWSGGRPGLEGMARALLRRGVTSFLPTAETAPFDQLTAFADQVRGLMGGIRRGLSEPLGFNIEGPFISRVRAGAQNEAFIVDPERVPRDRLAPLLSGLRVWTIAPELPGALALIRWLVSEGVVVSLGHSDASADEAAAAYAAGARSTTHLLNAMSGLDHHRPGLAAAALADDRAYVELIADGLHVERALWPIVMRCKAVDHLVLVSDAIAPAGAGNGHWIVGGLEVEARNGVCTLVSDGRLAGSLIALDAAVRNLVATGVPLPDAVRAASLTPLELIGVKDRGRIAPGQVADLVKLDEALHVTRVMQRGRWLEPAVVGS